MACFYTHFNVKLNKRKQVKYICLNCWITDQFFYYLFITVKKIFQNIDQVAIDKQYNIY